MQEEEQTIAKKQPRKKKFIIKKSLTPEPPKPTVLAAVNAHLRDANISFEEEGHIYTVLGERGTYTSVTTWVHQQFPHFDSSAIIDKILKNSKRNDPAYKYYGKTREDIEAEWEANRVAASSAGTKMHFDIECHYNGLKVENDSVEYAYFRQFLADFPHLEAYRTEWTVYHEELRVSGSIDMVFRDVRDGLFYIYDWKRSKEIKYDDSWCDYAVSVALSGVPNLNFWHYSLQLGIYRAILEEKYGLKIGGMFLVVLHPDNEGYQRIETADLSGEIRELFEERKRVVVAAG